MHVMSGVLVMVSDVVWCKRKARLVRKILQLPGCLVWYGTRGVTLGPGAPGGALRMPVQVPTCNACNGSSYQLLMARLTNSHKHDLADHCGTTTRADTPLCATCACR